MDPVYSGADTISFSNIRERLKTTECYEYTFEYIRLESNGIVQHSNKKVENIRTFENYSNSIRMLKIVKNNIRITALLQGR